MSTAKILASVFLSATVGTVAAQLLSAATEPEIQVPRITEADNEQPHRVHKPVTPEQTGAQEPTATDRSDPPAEGGT